MTGPAATGRRSLRAGLGLAALYAAVVVATAVTGGHPVRPLFDGAGASLPYKWVNPPWYVGSTNVKPPKTSTQEITFENGVSPLGGVNSADAQIILNLPQGAIPAHEDDTAVRTTFTALDPKKLAKVGGGDRPDGNAYRIDMTYQPSGTPVTRTTMSGNVIMIVPDEAKDMLFSVDGKQWDVLPTHMLGDPQTVGSAFNRPGYYLVSTSLPEFKNPNAGNGKKRVAGIALVVAALAIGLGYVVPTALRRRRNPDPPAPKGPPAVRTVKRRRR
ncbi:MAG TPA: hypothetical protein VHL53_11400 [Acidimicrobiia bacterium]|nr:hypothetical protein [Acidimicrobiia bacterium]